MIDFTALKFRRNMLVASRKSGAKVCHRYLDCGPQCLCDSLQRACLKPHPQTLLLASPPILAQPSRQSENQAGRYRTIHDVIHEGNIAAPTYSNVNSRHTSLVRSGGTSPGVAARSPQESGATTPRTTPDATPVATPVATPGTTPGSSKTAAYNASDGLQGQDTGTGSDVSPGLPRARQAFESAGEGPPLIAPGSRAPARSSSKASERLGKSGSSGADAGRPPVSVRRQALWAKRQ